MKRRRMGQGPAACVWAATAGLVIMVGCRSSSTNGGSLEKELASTGYVVQLMPLVHTLQDHRGIAVSFVDGDTSVDFAGPEERIGQQYVIINRFDNQHPELNGARERWTPLGKDILALMESWRDQPRECFRRHSDVIAQTLSLVTYLSESSTMGADSADVRSLAEAALTIVPSLGETMSQARDLIASMAGVTAMVRDEQRAAFQQQLGSLRTQLDRLKGALEQGYGVDPQLRSQLEPPRQQVAEAMTPVLERMDQQVVKAEYVKMTPDDWTPKATAAVDAIRVLQQQLLSTLQARLNARKPRA
ncbi:MAG TPA: nitrate- and nitrite sensing domain-containing protein [Candidatus Binatia bacterium]|nr:nitrate- and nitrite sensing domain-containing protein [Candidatus Binatia bacterium]